MKKRIIIYLGVGAVLIAAFFYWLYLAPLKAPRVETLPPGHEKIKKSMAETRRKVLVIGVDGMTWDIALPLIQEGKMPHLARLLARGAHGVLHSTPPLISPAIWTTFATGQPREVHGIDNFFAKVPFQYREVVMSSRHRRVPALWQMAGWAGKSVGVVNWYATGPAEQVKKGVFVAAGIERPGEVKDDLVYPSEWLSRVESVPLPRVQFYEEELVRVKDARVQHAYDQDRMVFVIALEILREVHPDLMMVYFQNVDVLSHGFWKYSWPLGLDYSFAVSAAERERYQGVIETHYQFTDRLIGGLLGEADDYTVIVVSDHGLGPTYPPHNIFPDLNRLLEQMGYLTYEGKTCEGILAHLAARGFIKFSERPATARFAVCEALSREARKWKQRGEERMAPPAVDAFLSVHLGVKPPEQGPLWEEWVEAMEDLSRVLVPGNQREKIYWPETRVWNGSDFHKRVQGLYVNLKDREPQGVVLRKDYKSFVKEVVRSLQSLRTEGGRKFFVRVKKNPAKPMMPTSVVDLPDILVEVNREALLDNYAFRGPDDRDPIPIASLRWSYHDVSADHVPEGVFLVSGRSAHTFKHVDARPLDLAPTVLWLLGLPVGADMPGRILEEAFEPEVQKHNPLYIDSWSQVISSGPLAGPAPPASAELLDRMKAIGYIQDHAPSLERDTPLPGESSPPP